ADMSDVPPARFGELWRETCFAVEPMERGLAVGDNRLHLDAQKRAELRVKSEHVDRAALAPNIEGDFDFGDPAVSREQLDDRFDDRGMILIEEPVESLSAPSEPEVDVCPDRRRRPPERADRDAVELTTIDRRDH